MDNQDQSRANKQYAAPPHADPALQQNPHTALPTQTELTDAEAQALLTVNNLEAVQPSTHSKWFVIVTVILIIVVIVTVLFTRSGSTTKNTSLPNANSSPLGSGTINQQVKYCSNIINANTVC